MFLNPVFLFLLPLAAIPVIIHLVNRRRFRIKRWAAMEFLIPSSRRLARRFKLKQILLLAARVGILLFLILALARPYVSPHGFFSFLLIQKPTVIVLLDNSLSMGYIQDGETRFELARQSAENLVRSLPRGSCAAVILLSDRSQVPFPKPISNLERLKSFLREATLTQAATDFPGGINCALDVLEKGGKLDADIYLVTDSQAAGWRMEDSAGWGALSRRFASLTEKPRLKIVDVSDGRNENCSFASLKISPGIVQASTLFEIESVCKCEGTSPETRLFTLYLDGEKKGTVSSENTGGEFAAVFHVKTEKSGYHYGWVEIDSDSLEGDNSRFLVVEARDRIKVLCVDGDPSSEPFKGETDFLKTALDPAQNKGSSPGSLIEPEVVEASALPRLTLSSYDVIIFANLRSPPEEILDELEKYVAEGGGLIVFPGSLCDIERYNSLLYSSRKLLPGRLLQVVEQNEPCIVSMIERRHEAMRHIQNPEKIRVNKYVSIENDREEPQVSVLAGLSSGSPWILERRYGRGKIWLFSTPCDADWSNFPLRPEYLPLIHGLIYDLRGDVNDTLSVNETIARELTADEARAEITIKRPGDTLPEEIIPQGRAVSFKRTAQAGIYTLEVSEGNDVSTHYYALNPVQEESDLKKARPDEVEKKLGDIPVQFFSQAEGAGRAAPIGGREIWKLPLLLVMGIAVVEVWLARNLKGG